MRLVAVLLVSGCLRTVGLGSYDAGWEGEEEDAGEDAGADARPACDLATCPPCNLACARTVECLADGGAVCGCACTRTVKLPGGTFTMGCDSSEPGCQNDETPAREVTVAAFEMHRTEVTQADYERCVTSAIVRCSERPQNYDPVGRATEPVTGVSITSARFYCASEGMRLPTEEEWEYAARLDAGRYPWGDSAPDCDRALFAECGFTSPEPAGAHPLGATPAGILGLADNVREWTSTAYGTGAGMNSIRGGAFDSPASALRSVNREPHSTLGVSPTLGFRCVK